MKTIWLSTKIQSCRKAKACLPSHKRHLHKEIVLGQRHGVKQIFYFSAQSGLGSSFSCCQLFSPSRYVDHMEIPATGALYSCQQSITFSTLESCIDVCKGLAKISNSLESRYSERRVWIHLRHLGGMNLIALYYHWHNRDVCSFQLLVNIRN